MGEIEDSLVGKTVKERAGLKALAIRAAWLSADNPERASFVKDGIRVNILEHRLVRDKENKTVGLGLRVTARLAPDGPFLPQGDGWHHVINPPVMFEGAENPRETLKAWLIDSVKVAAGL